MRSLALKLIAAGGTFGPYLAIELLLPGGSLLALSGALVAAAGLLNDLRKAVHRGGARTLGGKGEHDRLRAQ